MLTWVTSLQQSLSASLMSFTVGEKNHTPDQGALKAWKEYYASAEQSVVHIHWLRLGPGLDVWETEGNLDAPMTFPKPVQVI